MNTHARHSTDELLRSLDLCQAYSTACGFPPWIWVHDANAKYKTKRTFCGKEIKNAPSALLSYISTREFLRTREK